MSKHSVIISYSSLDQDLAEQVGNALRAKGIKCWVASQNIKPGQSWPAAISDAINQCEIFLLILTSNSNNSRQVIRELTQADQHNKILYCFQVEKIAISSDLLYFFSSTHRHEAFKTEFGESLNIMAEEISSQLRLPEKDEPVAKDDKNIVIPPPVTKMPEADQPLKTAEKKYSQNETLHQRTIKTPEIVPPIPQPEQKNLLNEDTNRDAEVIITDTQPEQRNKKILMWTGGILAAVILLIIIFKNSGSSGTRTEDSGYDTATISTETAQPAVQDSLQKADDYYYNKVDSTAKK